MIGNADRGNWEGFFQHLAQDLDGQYTESGSVNASWGAMKQAYATLTPLIEKLDQHIDWAPTLRFDKSRSPL